MGKQTKRVKQKWRGTKLLKKYMKEYRKNHEIITIADKRKMMKTVWAQTRMHCKCPKGHLFECLRNK